MNWWQSILIGIVEGLTEYLPVSSTGHILLTQKILGIPATESSNAYAVVVQVGAILAVLGLYFQRCRSLLEQVNRDIDLVTAGKFESAEPVGQRLALLQARWAGIIEVRWKLGPSAAATLDVYPTVSQQVSSILEEGINNACSHGRARVVDISVQIAENGNLQIQFVDDGQGPAESIEAGMGFREIETGGGSWQLDRLGASGARLMVTLPLRLSAASATGV